MMIPDAVFFDRDGTLLERDPAHRAQMARLIEGWSGRAFTPDRTLFERVPQPSGGVATLAQEADFWRRYYRMLLAEQGVAEQLDERTEALFEFCWCKGLRLYPETRQTLDWFSEHGCRMGVISDTYPSLRRTLETAGIAAYFSCFICSAEVGVMKPAPEIYRAALDALDVRAQRCMYVDDYDVEADGARALGFTAFCIVRGGKTGAPWQIERLTEMTEYAEGKWS